MAKSTKLRTALLIAALAFGISLLVVGKNAKAETSASIATPSFSSLQLRLTTKDLPNIEKLRDTRDRALVALNQHSVDPKDVKNQEEGLKALTKATNSIYEICGAGASHIQTRLKKNSNSAFWWSVLTGVTGAGTIAASALNASKGWSVATAASSYNSISTKEGDAAHNSETLTKILEDVRKELSSGATNYSKALVKQPQKNTESFDAAKSAVLEMNNACAFF